MKKFEEALMSKNGQVIVRLSREFLSCREGQRLKTVSQYVEEYQVARGTIQLAFKFLQESRAVSVKSRGHLGTFLLKADYQRLWDIAGLGSILGLMALPYTKRYEGLATGLYETFRDSGLPFNLAYMRGAQHRLDMLENKVYHFAITSKLAILNSNVQNKRFKIIYEFSEGSYVTKHGLILRPGLKKLASGMRLALDESSPDQRILTKKECQGIAVDYIPMSYNQILQKLESGDVDAAVWNFDELKEKNFHYNLIPLKNREAIDLDRNGTVAVMAIDYSNGYVGDIITRLVALDKIEEIQAEVLSRKKMPAY